MNNSGGLCIKNIKLPIARKEKGFEEKGPEVKVNPYGANIIEFFFKSNTIDILFFNI